MKLLLYLRPVVKAKLVLWIEKCVESIFNLIFLSANELPVIDLCLIGFHS